MKNDIAEITRDFFKSALDGLLLMLCAFGVALIIDASFLIENSEIVSAVWGK